MGDDFQERVKEAFDEALSASPSKRTHLLARYAPDLRKEVERLLLLAEQMGNFLDESAFIPGEGEFAETLIDVVLDGRYRIRTIIGEGGFGCVYRAQDTRLGCDVAVKVLHQGALSEDSLRTEINALSRIRHSSVVVALDSGRLLDGRVFLVMRFIEGETLSALIKERKKFDSAIVRRWGIEMAEALAEAHARGVFHLDLKPDNVLIEFAGTESERAVILDFGVARICQEPAKSNLHRLLARRPEESQDRAKDVQALCHILFIILTGESYSEERLQKVNHPGWRRLFRQFLETHTPASAEALVDVLSRLDPKPAARYVLAAMIATVSFATLVVAIGAKPHSSSTFFPAPIPLTSLSLYETFPSLSPDGRSVFFAVSQGANNADIFRLEIGASDPVRLTRNSEREYGPQSSHDGRLLAFLRRFSDHVAVVTLDLNSHRETVVYRGQADSLCWGKQPDRLYIAAAESQTGPRRLLLTSIGSPVIQPLTAPPPGSSDIQPSLSPSGRQLAFVRRHRRAGAQVHTVDVDAQGAILGSAQAIGPVHAEAVSPVWAPDGKWVYYLAGTGSNRSLWRADPSRATSSRMIAEAGDRLVGLAVARDEWRMVLARSYEDANIWRADLKGGAVISARPIIDSTWDDEEQAVSDDGSLFAFTSHRTGREQIWLGAVDGSNQRQLTYFDESNDLQAYWIKDRLWVTGQLGGDLKSLVVEPSSGATVDRNVNIRIVGVRRNGAGFYSVEDRGNRRYLLRHDRDGGNRQELLEGPVVRATESRDGSELFYLLRNGELWSVPTQGGSPNLRLKGVARRGIAVGKTGIYYLQVGDPPRLRCFRFPDGPDVELIRLQKPPGFGFALSPNEGSVLYTLYDQAGADLLLVDGFR